MLSRSATRFGVRSFARSQFGGRASASFRCFSATTDDADGLTQEQLDFYDENGYLVIKKFWSDEQCATLKNRMAKMLKDFDLDEHKRSIFSSEEQSRTADDYFLSSGDKIRYFWEEKAFDEDGNMVKPKELCINKVGHALHDLDPDFRAASYTPRLLSFLSSLGYSSPVAVQSMYITKQAGIGGVCTPHQDGTFLYTTPQSVVGFWWALEDCREHNGCLWAVPGSHKAGVSRRFHRNATNDGVAFTPAQEDAPYDVSEAVPLLTDMGDMVFLHHSLVHLSHENTSDQSRHAYTVHIVEGGEGVEYPKNNWLQPSPGGKFNRFEDMVKAEVAANQRA